ncbi:MAG: NAD(P)-dependent oxidoreductase [Selenomonadaceae bacterium]|nr:NAD(P)-dependent oxidoreductase [Selenomonadaceae bacterium]
MISVKIGFIGTGIMGNAMAGHLLDAGHEIAVYNRTKSKAQNLIDRGAKWCESPGECSRDRDVIITIVGYPKDVEEVYLGANGILENAREGSFVVDMTTSSPELAQRIFNEARNRKIHALDAPVTGGDTGAKNASLTILVGGDESDFNQLKPIFEILGKNIVYEGSAGAGQKTKAANQIAIAGALAGACEAFVFAKKNGLDVQKVFDAISTGSAASTQMSGIVKRGLDGNFDPGFMVKHLAKDLRIASESEIDLPIFKLVLEELTKLEQDGIGSEGTQALLKFYKF